MQISTFHLEAGTTMKYLGLSLGSLGTFITFSKTFWTRTHNYICRKKLVFICIFSNLFFFLCLICDQILDVELGFLCTAPFKYFFNIFQMVFWKTLDKLKCHHFRNVLVGDRLSCCYNDHPRGPAPTELPRTLWIGAILDFLAALRLCRIQPLSRIPQHLLSVTLLK